MPMNNRLLRPRGGVANVLLPAATALSNSSFTIPPTDYTDANGVYWRAHVFTTSGTLTFSRGGNVEYLIVAGGGGGGGHFGGGGGAGGLLAGQTVVGSGAINVTVGGGGTGGGYVAGPGGTRGTNGNSSALAGIATATGGGGGAPRAISSIAAQSGGSGGGGGNDVAPTTPGSGTSGQGSNGGSGFNSGANSAGGGGGGAGGVGGNAASSSGGARGAGSTSSLAGSAVTYAQGGGGGSLNTSGLGAGVASGRDALANSGGGGGGGNNTGGGGAGGSGIVIVRYRRSGGGEPPLDPRTISGMALWLDASNTSSLTFNGSTVSEWRDLSGNERHYSQATPANQPNGSTRTLNGLRALEFKGTDLLAGNSASLGIGRNVSAVSILAVAKYDVVAGSAGGRYIFLQSRTDNTNSARFGLGVANFANPPDGFVFWGRRNDADTFAQVATAGNTSPRILHGQGDYGSATARLFVDGVNSATTSPWLTSGSTPDTDSLSSTIGSDPAGQGLFDGVLAEIAIYHRALTASERQAIVEYLGQKWGIAFYSPPTVANAEAQDWLNRVYDNGGTVSATTAAAVNTFCNSIETAGIRNRFYRLNLFCGDSLLSALVPLYRAESPASAVRGNATDSNANFVAPDYTETGSSGGLTGGSLVAAKHLVTGLPANAISGGNVHASIYASNVPVVDFTNPNATAIGWSSPDGRCVLVRNAKLNTNPQSSTLYAEPRAGVTLSFSSPSPTGLVLGSSESTSLRRLYIAGSQVAENTTSDSTASVPVTGGYYVFALNSNGTAGAFHGGRLGAYSVGLSLSPSQVTAYNAAMQQFQTALARNA